ncbi:murein biosynthesis integral membrane protein MurJ [Pedobacter kyonggii]|uniref:Murein biosynthesis integral membrane protein MurJ n=1 Tax=Pedobacter kyonggii TaxID=1926871 RepID=A0A4Q9HGB0_9SPHI|nr:murein biosynthesis integral membrane protein MurJ [Pedobacter kyonggii]TBO44282.1 murein biosynthesis integral membrane protein MurJ [Pedobacter kyonggii]
MQSFLKLHNFLKSSILKKIGENPILRSSILIGIITAFVKLLGYGEKVVLAYKFGTGYEIDVYNTITTIIFSFFFMVREIIEPGFLNGFLKAMNSDNETAAWGLFNRIFIYIFFSALLLSVFVYFMPSVLIDMFSPGFSGQKKEMAMLMLKIAFPACIFLSLSALTNIALNGLKIFAIPASGDLVFKVCILLSIVGLYNLCGIYSVMVGILVGGLLKLLVHMLVLFKHFTIKNLNPGSIHLQHVWKLTWPILIGVIFSQISNLTDNIFASYLQDGAISALNYSKKIIDLPILVFPYILSVCIFPYFSELAIKKRKKELNRLFFKSLSWIVLVFVPLAVLFFMFSYEITEVAFKRGAFNEYSTFLTSNPLAIYAIGLPFFAIETVLVIFYFSNGDTRTPIVTGIICVFANIILTYLLVKILGYIGVALAHVLAKTAKVVILLFLLRTKDIRLKGAKVISFLFKIISSSFLIMLFFFILQRYIHHDTFSTNYLRFIFLTIVSLSGFGLYVFSLWVLRIQKDMY